MNSQRIRTVIGKGFGDEGKGLAVDYFCSLAPDTLVIKHNGGAQAGHTVELSGKRFVFHQLSAGSFRRCDTYWAPTYYPDLFKLREEAEDFRGISGFVPRIYSDPGTPVTLIDDVLINMLLETERGEKRHGSCGMGINEALLRTEAGFGIWVRDFLEKDKEELVGEIEGIREKYLEKRLRQAGVSHCLSNGNQYGELLQSEAVIRNAVEEMMRNAAEYVTVARDPEGIWKSRSSLVFETGQGLLLDGENREFAPHVTASRTGLTNPVKLLKRFGASLSEAVYVTRSYVTRHGAGPLPYACGRETLGIGQPDRTNVENPWQGSIRYGTHGTVEEFLKPVREDVNTNLRGVPERPKLSLFLTHLNETEGCLQMAAGKIAWREFMELPPVREVFEGCYVSSSREAAEVQMIS